MSCDPDMPFVAPRRRHSGKARIGFPGVAAGIQSRSRRKPGTGSAPTPAFTGVTTFCESASLREIERNAMSVNILLSLSRAPGPVSAGPAPSVSPGKAPASSSWTGRMRTDGRRWRS